MRVPIAFGLAWPHRIASGAKPLDFRAMANMSFEVADEHRFPGLPLAWTVLNAPVGSTAVLNAANEVAVAAFLDKRIRFDQIHHVNRATLDAVVVPSVNDIEGLLAIDEQSRRAAARIAKELEV